MELGGLQPSKGTKAFPYRTTPKRDVEKTVSFQAITAMPQYENKSFEELRLEDYPPTTKKSSSLSTSSQHAVHSSEAPAVVTGDNFFAATGFGAPATPISFHFPPQASKTETPPTGRRVGKRALSSSAKKMPKSNTEFRLHATPYHDDGDEEAVLVEKQEEVEITLDYDDGFDAGSSVSSNINTNNTHNEERNTFQFGKDSFSTNTEFSYSAKCNKTGRVNNSFILEGYECYRDFMDKLTESKVDDLVDLPIITVMGDTSSGKSSLLSNLSLVELPSSDKLTTRCPIKLQMKSAEKKWARAKVLWKDEPEGEDAEFSPRTVGEENWSDITTHIADAQSHIIQKSGKDVARDLVCVEIEAPTCENLTVVDLPGIVRSTGRGESSTIGEDIQALLDDYLQNDRCVILAVLPSNVDFHNSQILAEAAKVDEGTMRTIPVLTKPDLIDEGAETGVLELLLGKKTKKY